jgi:hypothetical protein
MCTITDLVYCLVYIAHGANLYSCSATITLPDLMRINLYTELYQSLSKLLYKHCGKQHTIIFFQIIFPVLSLLRNAANSFLYHSAVIHHMIVVQLYYPKKHVLFWIMTNRRNGFIKPHGRKAGHLYCYCFRKWKQNTENTIYYINISVI